MMVTECLNASLDEASSATLPERLVEGVIDPLSSRDWDHLVSGHPACTFFHSTAWVRALHATYGHQPVYRSYSRGGKVVALVPFIEVKSAITRCRGVCLPFSDLCPPLIFDQSSAGEVFSKIVDLANVRRWKYLEFRGPAAFQASDRTSAIFHGHSLDLRDGAQVLFSRFSSAVRRAIRKSERCGVKVRIGTNREDVIEYYRLHTESRRRHGVPPQPLSFFMNLHDEAIARGFGFVAIAKKDSHPIAGAVFLRFGGKAMYKFAALEFASQSLRGSNLVMWEAMKTLCETGCNSLHLGRTDLADHSLRRFKLGWGTAEHSLEYFRYEPSSAEWVIGRKPVSELQMTLFRRMPLAVNRWAGSVLYPHLD